MTDRHRSLIDVLPTNIIDLMHESERGVASEQPDFLPAVLCQLGLPRSPTQARTFERISGGMSLRIEAGTVFDGNTFQDQPLPYGVRPRLALVHIVTEAIRTNERRVSVGNSVNAFLTQLRMNTGGKAYPQIRQQMLALAVCSLKLGKMEKRAIGGKFHNVAITVDSQPFHHFEAWTGTDIHHPNLWPAYVELTPSFFETLRETAVPLEKEALGKLSHTALGLDLYTWMAHRLWRVRYGGSKVSWASLQQQFGNEYKDRKSFKTQFKKRLKEVLAVYADARVEECDTGIILHPSPSPVPRTKVRVHRLPKP